jgi:hypothetical protein
VKRLLAVSSAGLVMTCLLASVYAASGPESLVAARTLWSRTAPKSFSYVIEEHASKAVLICKGPGSKEYSTDKARITVREGRVVRIATVQNDEYPNSCLRYLDLYTANLHTMEGLFHFIERRQAELQLDIKYDAEFGFPSHISEQVLDGSDYMVVDFHILK